MDRKDDKPDEGTVRGDVDFNRHESETESRKITRNVSAEIVGSIEENNGNARSQPDDESPSGTDDRGESTNADNSTAAKYREDPFGKDESTAVERSIESKKDSRVDKGGSTSSGDSVKSKRGISEGQEDDGDSKVSTDESRNSLDADSSKRLKTDETADGSVDANGKYELLSKFHKLKSKVRKRNYRVKKNIREDAQDSSDNCLAGGSTTSVGEMEIAEGEYRLGDEVSPSTANEDSNPGADTADRNVAEAAEGNEELEEDSEGDSDGRDKAAAAAAAAAAADDDDDDDDSDDWTSASDDDSDAPVLPVLCKEKPKPRWFVVPELVDRQLGSNGTFRRGFYGSLNAVQRLELMYKLKKHKGCVNTLSFNQSGNLLASGSDDLMVVIWDWALGKKHHSFRTGHRSNVFQASWLPLPSESLMVTCARDGQVRLADLHKTTGDCTRRLATHQGPATKLAIHPDVPHVVLSASEDATVFSIDIRQSKPTVLLSLKEGNSRVAIYSVNSNPLNSNEFCLGGRDQFVRIYDKRKVSSPIYKLCPKHLRHNKNHVHVTSVKYSYNGSEVVASYNDEDIYLFDTFLPLLNGDFAHRYQGHRNSATVKGVNFFGPKSEFVISGSDCSNIFIWDKNTEAIVKLMAGDEQGVVNRLEPHPHIPVLATSGLDHDVKIWVPSGEESPSTEYLETCVRENMKSRERDISREPDAFDGQLLWFLWRHARQNEEPRTRVRRFGRGAGDARDQDNVDTSSDDTSDPSNSPSEDEGDGRPQCSPS